MYTALCNPHENHSSMLHIGSPAKSFEGTAYCKLRKIIEVYAQCKPAKSLNFIAHCHLHESNKSVLHIASCIKFIEVYCIIQALQSSEIICIRCPLAEFKKTGSTGSAEPNFVEIFRQICPVFHQIFILEHAN